MADKMRLIDAAALIKQFDGFGFGSECDGEIVLEAVVNAPTVEAVEVVRCKDCKYWFAEDPERCKKFGDSLYGWCHRQRNIYEADYKDIRQDNDFCSYGERREEE